MKHGLAVGKFYPPHIGHHKLIDTATSECGLVTVAVCYSSVENIPVEARIAWLRDRHPGVEFVAVHDDSPVLYTDITWGYFLDALMDSLWSRPGYQDDTAYNQSFPNVIYSGEAYAPEFADRLLNQYANYIGFGETDYWPQSIEVRGLDRAEMPTVSATNFRNDPAGNWDLLAPATRAGLCKRVVVCGAESSGTTTLARELARAYDTVWVPEYGRLFDESVGQNHEWTDEDFFTIAVEQKEQEELMARRSRNGLLICDTDEYATAMFSEFYLDSPRVGEQIGHMASASPADLYIITDHEGVEFEDDGSRRNEDKRAYMTAWFKLKLPMNHVIVSGQRGKRLVAAETAINEILAWDIETPLEYREDNRVEA